MIFSSVTYFVFFGVVLAVLALVRSAPAKRWFLLGASYVFYAWWDWRFLALLAGMTVLNLLGGKAVAAQTDVRRRKWVLGAVVTADLAALGVFKYYGFFVGQANALLSRIGFGFPALQIVLPVAISFITFEVIAYVVDIYRGELEPAPLFDLAMLVAFFPHLIAGPILKPGRFLPQVRRDIKIGRDDLDRGMQQIVLGLVKKVLIADRLAAFVDPVMSRPHLFSSGTLWLAVLAYAIQIYADFSGYSDMAIGSARCMGFEIPPNFLAPYASLNITEFWRRWNISLGTWLRHYLYFPLGGNRKGKLRQAANLMVVMLLAGLWHGASWNFVFWGGLHGAALVVHKLWVDHVAPKLRVPRLPWKAASWLLTLGFVSLAWVFFRVPDFHQAADILARMFGLGAAAGIRWYATPVLVAAPLVLLAQLLYERLGAVPRVRLNTFGGAFVTGLVLIALVLLAPTHATPFIYFQF